MILEGEQLLKPCFLWWGKGTMTGTRQLCNYDQFLSRRPLSPVSPLADRDLEHFIVLLLLLFLARQCFFSIESVFPL